MQWLARASYEARRWRHLWRALAAPCAARRDEFADIRVAGITERHRLGEAGSEMGPAVFDAREMARKVDSHRLQSAVVEVVSSAAATGFRVCNKPGQRAGQIHGDVV